MNLFKLFTLVLMLSVFAACGDDEVECVQTDWVGTYTGTITCTEDGTAEDPEDVTITVTASGTDKLIFEYDTDNSDIETDPLDFNGCDVNVSESDQGLSLTITANLDGDVLTFTDVFTANGESSTCVIAANRN